MTNLLITGKMTGESLESLKKDPAFQVTYSPGLSGKDLENALSGAEGLIIRTDTKITQALLSHAKKLKVICRAGIGVDHIDLDACAAKNIVVMNTPAANRVSTAEHTLTLILALSRKLIEATASLKAGIWDRNTFAGMEIEGKVLGIIGLGNIGSRVATRAQALGMEVIACDPYLDPSKASSISVSLHPLKVLLEQSDFVTLHVPLTSETRKMCSPEFFKTIKKGAYFVNASRGPVVDEKALANALNSGHLRGAALDVFEEEPPQKENPLFKCPNTIFTPHVAGQSKEAQDNMSSHAAQQIQDYFKNGKVVNRVLVQD